MLCICRMYHFTMNLGCILYYFLEKLRHIYIISNRIDQLNYRAVSSVNENDKIDEVRGYLEADSRLQLQD